MYSLQLKNTFFFLQAIATGAWAGSPENHNGEASCLDSWTGLSVKIPVGGLTPLPDGSGKQPAWAPDVVITPVAMLTLGQANAANMDADSVHLEYNRAYGLLGVVGSDKGQYGQGMLNSGNFMLMARLCSKVLGALLLSP